MQDRFGHDFDSKESMEEAWDAFVEKIGDAIIRDESRTAILNDNKFMQMKFAYAVLEYLTKGQPGVKLSYELNSPFKSMGYISLEGKELSFTQSEWFSRAAEFASNMEVYPLLKGRVRLTLTFHGLTVPIE